MKKRKERDLEDGETSPKKPKTVGVAEGDKNNDASAADLFRAVRSLLKDENTRLLGLTRLLKALKDVENNVTVGDIVKEGREFQEVFKVLELNRENVSQLETQTCLEILEHVLLFTSKDPYLASRPGMNIVQNVLQNHKKVVHHCLSEGSLALVTLRLLTAMVSQGTASAGEVQRSFDFSLKCLEFMPNRRHVKDKKDIRTCFIDFGLSFLMFGDFTVMKEILELKGFLPSILKGLMLDPPAVVQTVLLTLLTRVVENTGITKTTKVKFFDQYVLSQLTALYQYNKDAEEEKSQTVRQQVHELLLKICATFKFGICFVNPLGAFATRSNNPVLLRFLHKRTSLISDVLVQELMIEVLCCCQDLINPFLAGFLGAPHELKLSMSWVANINLVTKTFMALPQPSQMIAKAGLNIGVESLSSLVKMVIPVGVSRTILSRGVQHSNPLMKHLTLSLLVVILDRAQNAATCLASSDGVNEQTETTLLQQFREEILKGLCDLNLVISLRQNLVIATTKEKEESEKDVTSPVILHAQSLKVMLGFQRLWPSVFSPSTFDLKKLLSWQQEVDSPPIVQQLTLQILLQAPAGSLKWHRQKGKRSTSFVYSVLNLCKYARTERIRDNAKQLMQKLLSESELVSSNANEVDIWLDQLKQFQVQKGAMKTLLGYLDEVFTAVATEANAYAEVVINARAEVLASEANVVEAGVESGWNMTSDSSVPVSLLLVGALKHYTEMVSKKTESPRKADTRNAGFIARYMNCVIFDLIHCSANPTILSYVVCNYYAKTVIPEHLAAIRSVHEAVLCYAGYWLPETMKETFADFEDRSKGSDKHLKKLTKFLDKTTVDTEEEKLAVAAKLYQLLEPMDRVQFSSVIAGCVEFCKQHLSADFSPLVEVLQVKNYVVPDLTSSEGMSPLLRNLPFPVLLWQVFGQFVQGMDFSLRESQHGTPSTESHSESSLLCSSWVQNLLITALEREPESKSVSHCRHILLYLHSLKTKLASACNSFDQEGLKAATLVCFQLVQYLMQTSLSLQPGSCKDDVNLSNEKDTRRLPGTSVPSVGVHKVESSFGEDMSRTVLHHPVILSCFLWNPESSVSPAFCKDVGALMTYSITNLLLVVLPSCKALQNRQLIMVPFVSKLRTVGMTDVQFVLQGRDASSSEAISLVGFFHDYFDKDTRASFISSLCELPSHKLVRNDRSIGEAAPSAFLLALLSLLESGSSSLDERSHSTSSLRNFDFKAQELLRPAHFKRLIKISQKVNCPQLDNTILKLLQSSLVYVLDSTTTLLDACLDCPTNNKIALALHLVLHSPALRSHFELRCLCTRKAKEARSVNGNATTTPLEFKRHLKEFFPLVSSYLLFVHGMDLNAPGHARAREVTSLLAGVYWDPVWEWLVDERKKKFNISRDQCMEMLFALTQITHRDELEKKFKALLSKASSWDVRQCKVCFQLLARLGHGCSTDEKTSFSSKFSFACMEFLSSVLEGKVDKVVDEVEFADILTHLDSLCKESHVLSGSDDIVVSAWSKFFTNSLRYKFENANVLRTLRGIIQALYTEGVGDQNRLGSLLSLETLYEMVLNHSQFLDVLLSGEKGVNTMDTEGTKEALTRLMLAIVEKDASSCKSSHLPVLFAAYSATLSAADQTILCLLNLYEKNHISFKGFRPVLWGSAAANHYQIVKSLGPSLMKEPSVAEVLQQLDPMRMDQSAVLFPQNRMLQPQVQHELCNQKQRDLYDPCFLLPLFSGLLASNYHVDCRKFLEHGCLSVTLASLSSLDLHMRQAGYHVLSRFMMHLEGARFWEKKQIFHLLLCLKNGIQEAHFRLSSVVVCFVSRLANILLKPEHPFYTMMNKFLLKLPCMDISNVPLFFFMFNSTSMQHTTERSWILQLLVDGLKNSHDYYFYKRRPVIVLTLSYHNSPVSDHHSQKLIKELILSASKIQPAACDLVNNFGVIAWIHSLCHKSPESLSTNLNLLHTLWFTLFPAVIDNKKDSRGLQENVENVFQPSNVALEFVLVCWTLLGQLGSRLVPSDICKFLELLLSVLTYLSSKQQLPILSADRIRSLLHLWCAAFRETCALNQLLSSLGLREVCQKHEDSRSADLNTSKLKQESLSDLLSMLELWEPSASKSTDEIVLLVWRFGFCAVQSCSESRIACLRLSNVEGQTPLHLLSHLRWFRKYLVRSNTLQDQLVRESPAGEIKVLLRLYQTALCNGKTSSLEQNEVEPYQISSQFAVTREINIICLILFTAVQRLKMSDKGENAISKLVPMESPVELVGLGLEIVVFPILPDPRGDFGNKCCRNGEVALHELFSLFMQEVWMERHLPRQFLSFLLCQDDSGYPVAKSLIQVLGGRKVVETWLADEKTDSCS